MYFWSNVYLDYTNWLFIIMVTNNSNSNRISSSYGYLVHPWPPKLEEIMQNEIELSSYVGHEKSQNELSSLLFFFSKCTII